MNKNFTQLTFTDSVKQAQERWGTRKAYARMESSDDQNRIGEREASFIQGRDGFYLATVGEHGWPYVQFRGGPTGFLKVLDATTLGYADFRGNGQYISTGNMQSGGRAALFVMDYANRQRLKVWAETRVVEAEHDPALIARLAMPDYDGRIERAVLFSVQAWDWNCPQHITPRYTVDEIEALSGNPQVFPER